jgi:hypothetical protein
MNKSRIFIYFSTSTSDLRIPFCEFFPNTCLPPVWGRGVSADAKGGGGGKYEKVRRKERSSKSKRFKNKGKWK